MKKILSLVLILMLAFPMLVLAEIDLASLSSDELIELQTQIQGELMNRGDIKSANIPAGEYTIGVDIPAGVYSVTSPSYGMIVVNDFDLSYFVTIEDPVGKLELNDGDAFSVGGPIVLTTYTGISFN